jgi:hypothetical protein
VSELLAGWLWLGSWAFEPRFWLWTGGLVCGMPTWQPFLIGRLTSFFEGFLNKAYGLEAMLGMLNIREANSGEDPVYSVISWKMS